MRGPELTGVIGRDALTELWWARIPACELLVAGCATPDAAMASILEAHALLTGRCNGAAVVVRFGFVEPAPRVVERRKAPPRALASTPFTAPWERHSVSDDIAP